MYSVAVHGDILCLLPQAIQQSKELEISPDLVRVRRVDNPELWVLPPEDKVPQAPVHINSSLRPDVPVFVPGQRYTLPGRTENLALAAPSPSSSHPALVQLKSRDNDEQVPAEAYHPHHPHHSVPVASHLSHPITHSFSRPSARGETVVKVQSGGAQADFLFCLQTRQTKSCTKQNLNFSTQRSMHALHPSSCSTSQTHS